ncbi:flagellar assembly protein FliW [Romboutsia weinsteinii]|uniref:Flagellar assembly factor FliW n=1 Tax=Romboutsia weinsteinii TaxID=2020949 RepID=A0A255IP58_9FIRM|nr:flagellar assembly protein FliW [Romboutsia weinsteinii]RDY28915.1 flagellar assembly protein FliW [Romboutsia weinsteinii]
MEVTFKKGIPGFEYLRKFRIEDVNNSKDYKIIRSLEEDISFSAVLPFNIYNEYEIDLTEEIVKELEIKHPTDVLVLNIITLGKTLEESTVNLKAPVIINVSNNMAKQFIIQCDTYDTKHLLIRRNQNVSNY